MSFFLLAAAAAVAAGAAGFFMSRRAAPPPSPSPDDAPPPGPAPPSPSELRLALALGDVVSVETRSGEARREERWLEGALVARDGAEIVGAVFIAHEGTEEVAVAVFAPPRRDIAWLSAAPVEALGVADAELPSTLEIGGVALSRRARLPVHIERLGRGAPRLGERGVWAEYEATGQIVAIVLRGSASTRVWSGVLVPEGEYDRMGSGGLA